MLFARSCLAFLLLGSVVWAQDQCAVTWKCHPTTAAPPILDANHDDWTDVDAYTTTLVKTTGGDYEGGAATYKCLYDAEHIYFALEIPGDYRFSTEDNHLCAAVGTMFKIGQKATFVNMGGCPDALTGCDDGVPATCDDYRVDIGAHWELKGTEQNTLYGVADSVAATARQGDDSAVGSGNDLIANKDDEYSVSPYCRFDDDDKDANNEWAGAWAHTNPVDGEPGVYHFELSRKLKTASTVSDAQLVAGETIQFGIAFWDPYEIDETGWTDAGHYLTGCGTKWIDLELVAGGEEGEESSSSESAPASGAQSVFSNSMASISFLSFAAWILSYM